jgi:hypothetical protein
MEALVGMRGFVLSRSGKQSLSEACGDLQYCSLAMSVVHI